MRKLALILLLMTPLISFAHVKWFSDYSFQNPPLHLSELLKNPAFIGLFLLSVVSMPIMVWLDKVADTSLTYRRINSYLDKYAGNSGVIMRVTMGAVLLMSWQTDSIVAPEIAIPSASWGWLQFAMALGLLFEESTVLTGFAIVLLWFFGISVHGFFHMLDYVVYPSVGLFLILTYMKSEKLKNFDLPVLYSGLGFSLCWVSFEKLIYPFWGLSVLSKAPALTMGLPQDFFLMACAFVEFSLGYLLIICLLHRPLAIIITLTFFTTTAFFGKTEVVGHTILHGALLVFIVRGPGHYYQAPIRFHKSWGMRYLFAAANFIILFLILAVPYQLMANNVYEKNKQLQASMMHPRFNVPETLPKPTISMRAFRDSKSGWNIELQTENFKFTPASAGMENVPGEGHAHLFVNKKKVGRVYSNWIHLNLEQGKSLVKVQLTTNDHQDYFVGEKPLEAEIEITEDRSLPAQHQH